MQRIVAAMASAGERKFTVEGVLCGVRADGRGRLSLRPLRLSLGVLPASGGSARATVANSEPGSDVLASVKVEIVSAASRIGSAGSGAASATSAELVDGGGLVFGASFFGSGSRDGSGGGRAAEERGTALAAELSALYCAPGALPADALVIVPRRFAWRLCVDVLVLAEGGALLEAAAAAAAAALRACRLPLLRRVAGEAAGDIELELDEDPLASERLQPALLDALPLALALTHIAGAAVADATPEEEACADARVALGVTRSGVVTAARATGRAGLEADALLACLVAAERLAPAIFHRFDAAYDVAVADLDEEAGRGDRADAPPAAPATALLQGRYS